MRKLFLALGFLLALPTMAMAQSATPADPADAGYHVVAISAGAVAGVIVANALTGGLATPVMTIGAGGGVAVWEGGAALWSIVSTATGAVVGGYFGDWLYHR
jgi:hypothetical protein